MTLKVIKSMIKSSVKLTTEKFTFRPLGVVVMFFASVLRGALELAIGKDRQGYKCNREYAVSTLVNLTFTSVK